MSNVLLDQIESSKDIILVSESTLTIESLNASDITPIVDGHNLISISYSSFDVSDVSYHNSSLELMIVIFSTGNIQHISGSNIDELDDNVISLDYMFLLRAITIHMFDNIHFYDISLSNPKLIEVISSDIYSLKNHSISNTNTVIYTLDHANVFDSEIVSVSNSVSAFDIVDSTLTITSSSFTMLNSTLLSALYSESSNVTVSNSTFDSSIAKQGAAIALL